MKKLLLVLVCAICAFMLFACGEKEPEKAVYDLDVALDAKYKGLCENKKVYLTTVGQADIEKVQALLDRSELSSETDYTKKNDLTAAEVEDGSIVLMVIGASGKGLGAAGTDLNKEKKRATDFIEKENITIIAFHVGGIERRGDTTDAIIDIVAPKAKLLLVVDGANDDGKFSTIAKDNNVDLHMYSKTVKILDAVKVLFNK